MASDLEQMPHLLNFLKQNGTLVHERPHDPDLAHGRGHRLSSLTGLYPDRNGPDGREQLRLLPGNGTPAFTSSFKYWTDTGRRGERPATEHGHATAGKTTPAPWVPYTQAGCDVGGVGTANIELENTSTSASGDMTKVFGTGSPEWNEANTPTRSSR